MVSPPDRSPLGARPDWPARPSVDERVPALLPPEARSRTLVLVPTLSRVVVEPRTAVSVEVRLRTVVRVDTPLSTATPARRFWTMTALDGCLEVA